MALSMCSDSSFKIGQKLCCSKNSRKAKNSVVLINMERKFFFPIFLFPSFCASYTLSYVLLRYFSVQPLIRRIRFVRQHSNVTIIAHREADKKIVTAITIKKMTRLHHFWFTRLMLTMKTHNFSNGNTSSPFISFHFPLCVTILFSTKFFPTKIPFPMWILNLANKKMVKKSSTWYDFV